ncbi:MAG: N-acetyltransferase [Bacteroidetes bacterium]|nr:MAG: N-acetyltransferase [Bacteroidota bacterium]
MSAVYTTERLELREFSLNDVEGFFEMNADPVVIRFTGDRAFIDQKETEQFIQAYDQYEKYGYGRWSVYLKGTEDYLGFCGLKYSPEKQETDIGFRLMRKFWNKGFATEAAIACLDAGFQKYGLEKIVGRAMVDNQASIRVLEKLGMSKAFEYTEEGRPWVQYELKANDYASMVKRSLPE